MHAWERVFGSALLCMLLGSATAYSQSPELLTTVSGEPALTLGNAAALLGIVAGSLPVTIGPADAPAELRRIGFVLPKKGPTETISVGEFAYLTVQVLDLHGGLLYSIFPGPRYALRELESRRLIPLTAHPGDPISGRAALQVLGMLARARR